MFRKIVYDDPTMHEDYEFLMEGGPVTAIPDDKVPSRVRIVNACRRILHRTIHIWQGKTLGKIIQCQIILGQMPHSMDDDAISVDDE